ncbi:hypothetical protein F4778DRAFT_440261 [Xylariomycetidae sp. FL2044]|nr:hypothetical protein F4778DRAFT_440261 [Xylariomycetidae sp. FL2044]
MVRKRKTLKAEATPASGISTTRPTATTSTPSSASPPSSKASSSSSSSSNSNQQQQQQQQSTLYFWRASDREHGYLSQWSTAHPFRDPDDPHVVYPTAEHYMMYQKALLFGDRAVAAQVLALASSPSAADSNPRAVKALGRQVKNFDPEVWDRERERVVREGNWAKFSLSCRLEEDEEDDEEDDYDYDDDNENNGDENKNKKKTLNRVWRLGDAADAKSFRAPSFRDVLLATGDRELVEASPLDRIWGVGFRERDAERNRARWGLNLLGRCLMEVREQFRRENEEEQAAAAAGSSGGKIK